MASIRATRARAAPDANYTSRNAPRGAMTVLWGERNRRNKGLGRQLIGSQQEWSCGAFSQVSAEAAGRRRARRE